MKNLKRKFEDWMTIMTYAESNQAEMGFRITGLKALWLNTLAKGKQSVEKSFQRSTATVDDKDPVSQPSAPDLEPIAQKEKLEVLLVDDEPIVGKRLKPALTKYGYDVEVFDNPVKAIDRFDEKEFDVVVTDLRMDQLNGIQVLEHVKEKSAKTKVIFITAYATVENAREALVKGAFDFIAKPFKPNDLRMVIAKAALSLGFRGELAGVSA
ncbi:MAG: response regulator [Desulfobacterales bacterium]|jgi:CheY-like chemotaxis protein